MGRVIVTEFVSMDGVMEAPGGEPGYVHSGWMNTMPKYVVSTTLDAATWSNSTVLRDLGEVRRLKSDLESAILVAGSRTFVHGLGATDLPGDA